MRSDEPAPRPVPENTPPEKEIPWEPDVSDFDPEENKEQQQIDPLEEEIIPTPAQPFPPV